jgi:hypothetical protein
MKDLIGSEKASRFGIGCFHQEFSFCAGDADVLCHMLLPLLIIGSIGGRGMVLEAT